MSVDGSVVGHVTYLKLRRHVLVMAMEEKGEGKPVYYLALDPSQRSLLRAQLVISAVVAVAIA